MEQTNKNIKETLYELNKLIDSGDLHTALKMDKPIKVNANTGVPTLFKLTMSDFGKPPIVVTFNYE